MRTFYDILGISRSATQQEILVAYRKRCLETHPDKGGDGRDFMNVRKGYEILSNPEKRKAYDQWVLKKEKDELERKIKEQRVQNEEYLHKNASGNNKTCNNASGNNSTRHYTSDNKVNSEKKDDSSILIIGVVIILLSLTIYFINSNSNIPDKPLQYKNQDVTITSDKIVIKDIKWLYDELSKYSDIGSYSQFKEELKDSIMAGNLYINRGITGAIVNRQPFGGMKLSAFGGGVKAGGPNYCACFVNIADKPGSITDYTQSYVKAYEQEFAHARDVNNLYGEQNAFRYLPLKNMVLRLFPGDNNEDAKMIALAARICHTPLSISFEPGDDRTAALASLGCPLKEEALAGFLKSMKNYERIRTCGADIPMEMYEEAARIDKYIATAKPVKDGRVELIHYIKEQSISFEYHRYGSILEVPPVE